MPKSHKRGPYSKQELENRRNEVYRLHFEYGYSARKIAGFMKINRNTVNGDINYWYSRIAKNNSIFEPEYAVIFNLQRLEIQRSRLRERLDKSLFSFDIPDSNALQKMRDIIESSEIKPFKKTKSTTHMPEDAIRGNKEKIFLNLMEVLENDYNENISDEDINFDYSIFTSSQQPDAIHIKTRLFYPNNEGNIFYGRMIQRVAEDEYLLWVDD